MGWRDGIETECSEFEGVLAPRAEASIHWRVQLRHLDYRSPALPSMRCAGRIGSMKKDDAHAIMKMTIESNDSPHTQHSVFNSWRRCIARDRLVVWKLRDRVDDLTTLVQRHALRGSCAVGLLTLGGDCN